MKYYRKNLYNVPVIELINKLEFYQAHKEKYLDDRVLTRYLNRSDQAIENIKDAIELIIELDNML